MQSTIHHPAAALVLVTLSRAGGKTQAITCTPEHPLFVDGKGWVEAGSLGIGSSIVTRAGLLLAVKGVDWQRSSEASPAYTVYNFTVDKDHTYFVGSADHAALVHNVCAKNFPSFDDARRAAFEDLNMTNHANVTRGLEDASGTVVEFYGPNGEKIAYDGPHADMDPLLGHDKPHIGVQFAGKRYGGGGQRWNYTYDGPAGPARP